MDVSTEDCVTFYTSNTIITVASGIDANEPFQNKAGKENRLTGMKFSCLFEWGQNGQGFKKKKYCWPLLSLRCGIISMVASAPPTSASFSYQWFNVCFRAHAPRRERFWTAPKNCRGYSFLLRRKSNHTSCRSRGSSTSERYVWTAVHCLKQLVHSSPRKPAISLVR